MKTVWQACKFSEEIETGEMDLNKFAVELHSFLRGNAHPTYQDPQKFLDKTYLTDTMAEILGDTILRLNGRTAEHVHSLATGFGAGKTHTLILLHQIINNPDLGMQYVKNTKKLDKKIGTCTIPDTKVVAIDCRQIKCNTLWGEIAQKIGQYELFEKYDKTNTPPPDIDLITDLFKTPTLLMIDELLHYLYETQSHNIGSTTLSDMTLAFFMKLLSAISSTKNSKLIYTLSQNIQIYDKQIARVKTLDHEQTASIKRKLHAAQARQARSVAPVNSNEIFDVVRTRLVSEIDESARDNTVTSYMKYYDTKDVPTEPNYRQQMLAAYPFHPFLLKEILYERVSTIPDFNLTRGILRLMSLASHHIIHNKSKCYIIGPGDIDLENSEILNELTAKLDLVSTHQPIAASDCITKSKNLDKRYSLPLITIMSRVIYLYSLIGTTIKSGIHANKMKLAIGRPDLDLGLVNEGLSIISDTFWFINDSNGYYFDKDPNINKIIADFETGIQPEAIRDRIEKTLVYMIPKMPGKLDVHIWKADIPECDILTLAVLDPSEKTSDDSIKQHANHVLGFLPSGNSVRKNKNTLIFLCPDHDLMPDVEKAAKHFLAIEKAQQQSLIDQYDNELNLKLVSKKNDAAGNLEAECYRAHHLLAYPTVDTQNNPIIYLTSIMPNQTSSTSIADAVLNQLKDNGKLIKELSKDGISLTQPATPAQLLGEFKTDRTTKMIENQSSVLDAAINAVSDGLFYPSETLNKKNGQYTISPNTSVGWSTFLIPKTFQPLQQCQTCGSNLTYSVSNNIYKCKNCDSHAHPCSMCNSSLSTKLYNDKYYCPDHAPGNHKYKISCNTINDLINTIQILRLATIGITLHYSVTAELSNDFSTIDVRCNPKNLTDAESLFQMLRSTFDGSSIIFLTTQTNITEQLDNEGVTYENI